MYVCIYVGRYVCMYVCMSLYLINLNMQCLPIDKQDAIYTTVFTSVDDYKVTVIVIVSVAPRQG
jgi:hypothetical protein